MKAKPTPGPWRADTGVSYFEKLDETIFSFLVYDVKGRWIGAAFACENDITIAEAESNALLMASASALRDVLAAILPIAKASVSQQLSDGAVGMAEDMENVQKARDLLYKLGVLT